MKPFVQDNLKISLHGKKILLGISGSIAAFKSCDIVRGLRDCGAEVRVVLTESASQFVTKTTLETLSGAEVLSSLWAVSGTHHIQSARWADLALVAPASANTLAKLAHGSASDLLSTEILAFQGPVLIAPAMNPAMFAHPGVLANLINLRSYGYRILGPVAGPTACGEEGLGRMSEPEDLVQEVAAAFYRPKTGKKLLITLGPTSCPIDPVRFISNRSSGLMGAALCWAGVRAGFDVAAICGQAWVDLPSGIEVTQAVTAAEMQQAVLSRWSSVDVYVGAAAVLDWEVSHPATAKLKKEDGEPRLSFHQTPDILAMVAEARRPGQFVLGFAAESGDPRRYAREKLKTKRCDAVFANDISAHGTGFGSDSNAGWWIPRSGSEVNLPLMRKVELADKILTLVSESHATTELSHGTSH